MRCHTAWHRINKIQTSLSLILLNFSLVILVCTSFPQNFFGCDKPKILYGVLLYLLMFHPFFTVFIIFLLLPSLNIPSVYIQHFTFLPHNYFQLFLFLVLAKHTDRKLKPVRARLKKWNNGLMVKTLGFQSRGSSWGAPRSSQPIIFLRVKFLLFVWVATYKVGVTTLYIDSLMPNFVYWCLALSTLNYLTVKGEIDFIFYIDLT